MTDTAFDPSEILRERIVALENEFTELYAAILRGDHLRDFLAKRGFKAPEVTDGNDSSGSASVSGS